MEWNEIRNNTSFATEVVEYFKSIDMKDLGVLGVLRYAQVLIDRYFKRYPVRGMLLFMLMGMGKSLLAAAILHTLMKERDAIFISGKTLHINFSQTLDKFTKLTGLEYSGKINFVSLNASNMMTQVNRATLSELETFFERSEKMRGSLNGKVIIVDEAHNFFNSITNGSDNATKLYHAIMDSDCRVLFLTGSPITNDPFEIALCFNMLAGRAIFPESYVDFTSYFVKTTDDVREIKNAGKFANRINGMVTYYDTNAKSSNTKLEFPTELPLITVPCTMSKFQYGLYFNARKNEIEQQLKKKKSREAPLQKTRASNASYRVMSRQLSNFAYPTSATRRRRNEKGILVDEHFFEDLEPADVFKNIAIYSPKIKAAVDNAIRAPGIGIIYSQYLKYGLNIVAMYIDCINGGREKDKIKYVIISGETDKDEVAKLLEIVNSDANKDANLYKLVLISAAASEGVDFKNIRHIHILEPYWHWSRILQIIGRGVRFASHLALPLQDRTVQPYLYIAEHGIVGNTEETTDQYLLNKSLRNQHLINSFYSVMKMSAIDCPMHYDNCKICAPTNRQLFAEDILIDMAQPDPCQESQSRQARIFEYDGIVYAEYEENGEIYYARLGEDGKYEKVAEDMRLLLLSIVKKYKTKK